MNTPIRMTRICNACVLIELGEHAILTDPYFINRRIFRVDEEVAMTPAELPRLSAIIGCHDVGDHWQMDGLDGYRYDKAAVPVFTAMPSQVKSAQRAGFTTAEVLPWGETRAIGDLEIESVEAQVIKRWTINNYALRCGDARVFFGSEARDLPPIEAYGAAHDPFDVAVFPVNGVHIMGTQLVMHGEEAAAGAEALQAQHLFVIHDAHLGFPLLMPVKSSGDAAEAAASDDLNVVRHAPGVPWQPPGRPSTA